MDIAPGVAVELLVPQQAVTVSGFRTKRDHGPWVVTEIRTSRPGF